MRGFIRNRLWNGLIFLVCLIAALAYAAPSTAQESMTVHDTSVQEPAVPQGTDTVPAAVLMSPADKVPAQDPAMAPAGTPAPRLDRDLNSLSIEELMEIEVQTVVSASRYRQKVSDAPASVTIITAEDIRKYGYRTLADILRSVRGFYTTYDRTYDYIGVRGFGRLGGRNTRILLLVDGHRLNDAIFDSAPIGTEFPLDVDLIERVEVTRGPGSSLYGSNAFFGVVNVVTRPAKDIGGRELSAEAGGYHTYKARLSSGTTGKNDQELLASASGFASEGDRLYFREYDPGYPLADLRAANGGYVDNGDYDDFRSAYAKYERGGLRLVAAYLERTKGVPTAAQGADFNEPDNQTVDERGYLDLQYSARTERGDEYTARAYYDLYRFDADRLYTGTLNKDLAEAASYGGEARVTTSLLNVHRLITGVEYEIRGRQDQWNGDIAPSSALYLDDRRRSRTWAAYIQDEITISPVFLLYAGIRRDEVSTFGGATNPRLAAVLTPVEHGTLKLLYGRAFRAPTVYEMFYEAPTTESNPGLQPETIDTYELAYEHDFGKRLRATVSRYSYSIKNLITQTYDSLSGSTSFQNQEKAVATGIELEVQKTWENGSDGRISYAYQKAEDPNTGELLSNSPRHLAKLNVDVPLAGDRFRAGLEEQYIGPRHTEAGRETPGTALTNVTILGRDRERTLEVSLSIYNLLDKRYADVVSIDLSPLDTVQQDGRTVRVKVTYAF